MSSHKEVLQINDKRIDNPALFTEREQWHFFKRFASLGNRSHWVQLLIIDCCIFFKLLRSECNKTSKSVGILTKRHNLRLLLFFFSLWKQLHWLLTFRSYVELWHNKDRVYTYFLTAFCDFINKKSWFSERQNWLLGFFTPATGLTAKDKIGHGTQLIMNEKTLSERIIGLDTSSLCIVAHKGS